MRCDDAGRLMLETTDEEGKRRLAAHVAECPECAAQWDGLKALDALLNLQSLVDPPEGFADRVATAVACEAQRPPAWKQHLMQGAWILTGLLVMASGFLSLATSWQGMLRDPRAAAAASAVVKGAGLGAIALTRIGQVTVVAMLMYGALAAAMALCWFGALVLPRHALRPIKPRA